MTFHLNVQDADAGVGLRMLHFTSQYEDTLQERYYYRYGLSYVMCIEQPEENRAVSRLMSVYVSWLRVRC